MRKLIVLLLIVTFISLACTDEPRKPVVPQKKQDTHSRGAQEKKGKDEEPDFVLKPLNFASFKADWSNAWLEILDWPTEKTISSKTVPASEITEDVRMFCFGVRSVLKPCWLPRNLEQDVIAVRNLRHGGDFILTKYNSDVGEILICEGERLNIALPVPQAMIKKKPGPVLWSHINERFMQKTAHYYLNFFPQLTWDECSQMKVHKRRIQDAVGGSLFIHTHWRKEWWWQQIRWYTDGKIVVFSFPRWFGQKYRKGHGDNPHKARWGKGIPADKVPARPVQVRKFGEVSTELFEKATFAVSEEDFQPYPTRERLDNEHFGSMTLIPEAIRNLEIRNFARRMTWPSWRVRKRALDTEKAAKAIKAASDTLRLYLHSRNVPENIDKHFFPIDDYMNMGDMIFTRYIRDGHIIQVSVDNALNLMLLLNERVSINEQDVEKVFDKTLSSHWIVELERQDYGLGGPGLLIHKRHVLVKGIIEARKYSFRVPIFMIRYNSHTFILIRLPLLVSDGANPGSDFLKFERRKFGR